MKELTLLLQIALRNLFASFLNVIIGGIILVGTLVFVVGSSLLDSVNSAMSRSITGSIAGHIQVYSDKSKDELSLLGNWQFPDIAAVPDFSKVKGPLLGIDNVKAVVPMGVNGASVMYGNSVDTILEKLRFAINARIKDNQPVNTPEIASLQAHVRQMMTVIAGDYKKLTVVVAEQAVDPQSVRDLERASSDAFWADFEVTPLDHLEFLENHIAALVPDADFIYLSYAGTDIDAFAKSFDRMKVIDGTLVPTGHRGIMLSKYTYEHFFKLRIASRLDTMHEALDDQGKHIATDPDLQHMVKQNQTQTRELILQLDPLKSHKMVSLLQSFLDSQEADLTKLLGLFFSTDDTNFSTRYRFFYDQMAPLFDLYRLKPGDALTIKAFTKGGFMQSANLTVYGTFNFQGLEKSGLAGSISLIDLMSFRDLYGYVTPDKLEEIKQLEASAGAKIVDKDSAEAELFGGSGVVGEGKEEHIDEAAEIGDGKLHASYQAVAQRVYTREEIETGVVLDAAVILKDPTLIDKTMADIDAVAKKDGLGLRVISWQKAAGMLGQLAMVAKAVLYFAVFIIFLVALAVINNAVMMATLQRIREIGTMRAIGAQRSFVLSMVIIETVLLGVVFGSAGAFLGSAVVQWAGQVGIPAGNEFMYFFFSGPRLFPSLNVVNLVAAFAIIVVVTCLSALYPAIVATRVSPIQAMQAED